MSTSFDAGAAPGPHWAPAAAGVISPLFAAWRRWRKTRRQTGSLSGLSDHQLRNIGFVRDYGAGQIVRRP